MSSLFLVIIGFSTFFIGYKIYSRYLAINLFEINDQSVNLPSKDMQDGLDYYPTKKESVHHTQIIQFQYDLI